MTWWKKYGLSEAVNECGGDMGRKLAVSDPGRGHGAAGPTACLLFVLILALAFWAGAVWIGEHVIRVSAL
jgi:hypothetical protein